MSRRQSLHRKVVIKEGFLTRAPAGKLAVLKSWERRWFVFGTQGAYPCLEAYTDPQAVFNGSALDRIELHGCQQIVTKMITVDARHPHCFNLILSDRVLCLATDTRNEMVAWCKTLQKKLEELGCLTVAHDNVYEECQQLSRLRQVGLHEEQLVGPSRTAAAAAAVEQQQAAAVTRRPRAATPVSPVADDAVGAESVAAVVQPTASPLVENDFAPTRRRTAPIDSEARMNFGRLLAICGQGACEAGVDSSNCSCSSCSNSTNGEVLALPSAAAETAAASMPPPAAIPRRSTPAKSYVAAAAAIAPTSRVANLSLDSNAGLIARHDATPESSFRPIDAPPPLLVDASVRGAPPVARPVAVSGAAAAAAAAVTSRASRAEQDRQLPAASRTAVSTAAQQQPPPVARTRTERMPPQQPAQRSEYDFFVQRSQPVAADPDERIVGASTAAAVAPPLAVPCRNGAGPLAAPRRLQDDDDDPQDDGGTYETLIVGPCVVAAAGAPRGAVCALATERTRTIGLERHAGDAVENEYNLLPETSTGSGCRPPSPVYRLTASASAAAGDRAALRLARPVSGVSATTPAVPQQHGDGSRQQQPRDATSADRPATEKQETACSTVATDYVNWSLAGTSAEPKAEMVAGSSGLLEPATVLHLAPRAEGVSESDDDVYDDAPAFQLLIGSGATAAAADRREAVRTAEQPPTRVSLGVTASGRVAHGNDSYSEAMAASDDSYSEAMATSPDAGGCDPPEHHAVVTTATTTSTAVYSRLATVPTKQQQASSKPTAVMAEPPPRRSGGAAATPSVCVTRAPPSASVRSLAVEPKEHLDWTRGSDEPAPPLPRRLHGLPPAGKASIGDRQSREDHEASTCNGRGGGSSSSSSGDDVPLQLPALAARPPRARPKAGGTLMFGGALLKMPSTSPASSAVTNCEAGGQPIRQSQVEELLGEVNNAGGVKVSAYKKEVSGNICFVDVDNRVWVAGWNQKSQPLLQKLLHIGDEVIALNHEPVTSCAALSKSIRMGDNDRKLSFVLRRLPLATVLSIRRRYDGEDIGIRCQTGTPEVDVVVPGGLAHTSGLRPRATTYDSLRQCNWFLTEINNRPLNLFFKNSEVEPRLSAVGKDVTLVLQPADFISKLKKQLKGHWGYKSYILQ